MEPRARAAKAGSSRDERVFLTAFEQINQLTELRAELPWLADVPPVSRRAVLPINQTTETEERLEDDEYPDPVDRGFGLM